MPLSATTQTLLEAKRNKGLSFSDLERVLERDEIWIAALFYGQASASPEEAAKLLQCLDLPPEMAHQLTRFPTKGALDSVVPTDPFLYSFYEILQVYGLPLKDVIQEKFGDGIMSAIDFTMHVEKEENPNGDRVVLTMNGKFLPYKKW